MIFKTLKLKRLPNLDALRFILASLVILFHLPQLSKNQGLPFFNEFPVFERGTEAVYMFFVLSGFLIIKQIYVEKQEDVFSIKKFYVRRMLRIFPLYYLIVFFGLFFYNVLLPILGIPFDITYQLPEALVLTMFFLPNVFSHLYHPGGILEILWSIGIEEQFYLMIAPLLFFINKRKILFVLSLLTIGYFIMYHTATFYFLKQFRFMYFYLFFGGIIAILEVNGKLEFLKSHRVIPLIIISITLLYFITDFFKTDSSLLYNLISTVLFGFFIHTIAYNNKGLEIKNKLINYLGTISYGIYMYHVIAMNLTVFVFLKLQKMSLFNDAFTILFINIMTFVITIIVAHLSYNYFESYFLNLKRKFRT